jgi:ketosteroid isomerase-like protein
MFLCAIALASGCVGDKSDAGEKDRAGSTSAEDEVRDVLTEFAGAVGREDLDGILVIFSEQYESNEAIGKAAVREWWTRVISTGLSASLPLDLETAELTVDGNIAQVAYFDESGELACPNTDAACQTPQRYLDFRLEKNDQLGWLITGIPSEGQ